MKSNLSENTSVGDIVTRYPNTRNLLEDMGIDYCCGGKQTLRDACSKAGLSVQEALRRLAKGIEESAPGETQSRNWSEVSLTELAQHIVARHHAYLKDKLPRLDGLIRKVYDAHHQTHGETIRKLQQHLERLRMDIEMHLAKEEQILFPMIEEMEQYAEGQGPKPVVHCGTIANPIRQMNLEHEAAGELLDAMRTTSGDYQPPKDACKSFQLLYDELRALENDLHEHIHLENNILFPQAVELEKKLKL